MTCLLRAVAAAVLVVIVFILVALVSLRPLRPHSPSSIAFSRRFIGAAAECVSRLCPRESLGGLAGVVLMCIGSFSNSFVEAEATVALHAHVAAGKSCSFYWHPLVTSRVTR